MTSDAAPAPGADPSDERSRVPRPRGGFDDTAEIPPVRDDAEREAVAVPVAEVVGDGNPVDSEVVGDAEPVAPEAVGDVERAAPEVVDDVERAAPGIAGDVERAAGEPSGGAEANDDRPTGPIPVVTSTAPPSQGPPPAPARLPRRVSAWSVGSGGASRLADRQAPAPAAPPWAPVEVPPAPAGPSAAPAWAPVADAGTVGPSAPAWAPVSRSGEPTPPAVDHAAGVTASESDAAPDADARVTEGALPDDPVAARRTDEPAAQAAESPEGVESARAMAESPEGVESDRAVADSAEVVESDPAVEDAPDGVRSDPEVEGAAASIEPETPGRAPHSAAARPGSPPPERHAPPATPRVYVDGSALSRYLAGAPARDAWLAWTREHEAELVTTPLGLTELRRVAQPRGVEAHGTAHEVAGRIEVTRFSDQTLRKATSVTSVLSPFLALHLGAALAHPDVTAVATYDVQLARVASLYGLRVVTPGWPDKWWERDLTPWG